MQIAWCAASLRWSWLMLVVCALNGAAETIRIEPIRGQAEDVYPFFIPDFADDASGAQMAQIIRRDLNRYGAFSEARITAGDARTLDNADRTKNIIHYSNWANLGAMVLGKGSLAGGNVDFALYLCGAQKRVMGKRYPYSSATLRRVAHTIADDIIAGLLKEKGFFASRLLYVKQSGASRNIYVCDSDGAAQRPLTRSNNLSIFPDWFPDRQNIIFTSYLEGRPIIYKLNIHSGQAQKLVAMPGMNTSGAISPNGRQIAAILDKDGMPELYVLSLSGATRTRLTHGRAAESSPSWSPDGQNIVYSSEEQMGHPQIYIIAASGGTPRRISNPGMSPYCTSPAWSPDGKKIAFVAQVGGNFEICVYDMSASKVNNVTGNSSNDEAPSWANNSRHIAFCRAGSQIMLVDSETGKTTSLLAEGGCLQPQWEP
ncbi:MAG: LpqB family beta-propeller domain-containing protein [bacterium]|nr:LpqB family beta-propeller domain-containing protein [bacterium]